MTYKKPLLQIAMEETGWKEFKGEDELPEAALPLIEKTNMFQYPGGWHKAFYKGDQWIIVTNNGGFYKVGAEFMVWLPDGRAFARWSTKTMKEAVMSIMREIDMPFDPNYQT
jgi:hypothetical protein